MHAKFEKIFNADKCFTCQAMKCDFPLENFFYITLTGKLPVNNKRLRPFTPSFFLILTDVSPVSGLK